jgi:predicted deacetylase
MIPTPAQYLLRFDDLCPTVSVARWQHFLPIVQEFGLKPILAVVPDNRDRSLRLSPPDPEFWAQMRALEAAGASIALHGYRHLCKSKGKSLVPLHGHTEFAGVSERTQREWIRAGLEVLRGEGLHPKIWVAPRHGFDRNTLRALRSEGIGVLSDGFARVPFTRGGMIWVPQQLWGPLEKSKGLWTICIHSNSTHRAEVGELRDFLRRHAGQFTSLDRVLAEFTPVRLDLLERIHEAFALWKVRSSRVRKGWTHHSRHFRGV